MAFDSFAPPEAPDLLVLSHLRWVWVWQRPQHIVSRLAKSRRTWFVEEPVAVDVDSPRLRWEQHGDVTRVWLEVPEASAPDASGDDHRIDFGHPAAQQYAPLLSKALGGVAPSVTWLYTPMAIDMAADIGPSILVFDVMDDLASFKDAAPELVLRHRQTLRRADVVFTGGRSLHRGVVEHRPEETHLFPSGVEPEHYAAALARQPGDVPVAGYVGVIDERLDLDLIRDLASSLPHWEIRMVGPIAKISPDALPKLPNIRYLGPRRYEELPEVMREFDVALMPFAMNESTRSISPTKTLEYLAAGLPVVSTRVPDVVSDYGSLVDLQDEGIGFAQACERVRQHCPRERAARAESALQWQHWDAITDRMWSLIEQAERRRSHEEMTA